MKDIETRKETSSSPERLIMKKGITWLEGPGYFGKEIGFLAHETASI